VRAMVNPPGATSRRCGNAAHNRFNSPSTSKARPPASARQSNGSSDNGWDLLDARVLHAKDAPMLIELSHPIRHGLVTYPGLPAPEITEHLSREAGARIYGPGTSFQIGRISMVANTGTYLDSPFHRFADGADLAQIPLEKLVDLDGITVRATDRRSVDQDHFAALDVEGKAVLIHTGWDRHWETPGYGVDAPFLTAGATRFLVEQGAALVGIDSVNLDDMADKLRPAHTGLLRAGIPIVEHLCGLEQLPPAGFRFHAAPPRIEGFGTFPVRAWASVTPEALRGRT
jgi:kynurenine formamidase